MSRQFIGYDIVDKKMMPCA